MVTQISPRSTALTPVKAEGAAATAEDLLGRVAIGDERAFAALYDVLAGPIMGMAVRVVRSRAMAEEVTQEVLVEIWRKAAEFSRERGSAMSWALTIAHRRAIDRVRSEQASADREERAERLDLRRPFDDVAEGALATLDKERVRKALSTLTELQRESILLAYYKGFTYREVAEVLKSPVGTIKTRMRDGLARLRDALGAH